jgi:hypothetical protein
MTPILVLLFGVGPVVAVGTDLWFAAGQPPSPVAPAQRPTYTGSGCVKNACRMW